MEKTSVLEHINKVYRGEGYKVVIVSETATELMGSGITFRDDIFARFFKN